MTLINGTTAKFLGAFKNRYDENYKQLAEFETKQVEAEKNVAKAKDELQQAQMQGDKKLIAEKQQMYNDANNALLDNSKNATQSMADIYTNLAISLGASLGEAILQGKNAFDTLIGLAFDFLDRLVPIWSAQILGFALATPDAILSLGATAFAKWTALTLVLKGAVAGARSLAGFKDGVINLQGAGTGTSDSINARLSAGESVITAKATAINEPFLRFANNGGDLGKLFSMNINNNNSNLESLMIENNNILRSKNLSVNNVNKFNVSSKNISIVRGR
jgi:hypothetical protein